MRGRRCTPSSAPRLTDRRPRRQGGQKASNANPVKLDVPYLDTMTPFIKPLVDATLFTGTHSVTATNHFFTVLNENLGCLLERDASLHVNSVRLPVFGPLERDASLHVNSVHHAVVITDNPKTTWAPNSVR